MPRIVCGMMRLVSYATLFSVAIVAHAFAQTTVSPSGVTSGGVVNLGNNVTVLSTVTGANPSTVIATQPTTPTISGAAPGGSNAGTATTSSSAGGGTASASGTPRARSSSSPSSGGSSASATGTASSNVPAWLLCPPSGASGTEPFVSGTSLSCAP